MTLYIRNGSTYRVADEADLQVERILPPATYTVKQNPMTGEMFFSVVDSFSMSGKIYGDTAVTAARIMNTFDSRPSGTGVMLAGEKGSGKTLLAKMLSVKGMEEGIVTILINQPWHGEAFNAFIQSIEQPAILIFDEFEKVYNDNEAQNSVLTLLDGTYPSKKLFVVTCNDRWKLSEYMHNRPGRFFYALEYYGLTADFIAEYCEDNLNNKEHVIDVVRFASTFRAFNFDMLKAMVEEMNRYSESVIQVLKYLNVSSRSDKFSFDVKVFTPVIVPGMRMPKNYAMTPSKKANNGGAISIVSDKVWVSFEVFDLDELDEKGRPTWYDENTVYFTFEDLVTLTPESIVFKNDRGYVELTRATERSYSMADFL